MRQDLSHHMFVSPEEILGYNSVLNFVNSGRGLRKTHNYLLWACRRYIKHQEQFIYARRQQNELDDNAFNMFTGIEKYNADLIPAGSFRVVGNAIIFNRLAYGGRLPIRDEEGESILNSKEERRDKKFKIKIKDSLKEGDEIAGHLMALSTAHTKKSTSYPDVRNLIFDEYQLENGKPAQNEVSRFVSLTETVFRDRDDVRAFLLGNTTSIVNIYYNEYAIAPDLHSKGEITLYRSYFPEEKKYYRPRALIQNADRPLFAEYKQHRGIQLANRFTRYGRHIVENVSITDDAENCGYVRRKWFQFNFIADGRDFGIYTFHAANGYDALYVGQPSKDKNAFWRTCDRRVYSRTNYVVITSKSHLKNLIERYSCGSLIYFENVEIKQYVMPYLL